MSRKKILVITEVKHIKGLTNELNKIGKITYLDNPNFDQVKKIIANYDAIFSRFGVMFFEDPTAAFKNLKKSLVGNGRLTFVCWSNREENDWINLSSNVASQFLELPPKANPKDPGPFAFEDYFYIKEILIKAGWSDIKIKAYKKKIIIGDTLDSASDFLSRMGPMSVPFENANEQTKEKVVSALKECYSKYFTPKGVEFHFSSWIVSALNP